MIIRQRWKCLLCLGITLISACNPRITVYNYDVDIKPEYRMKKVARLGKFLNESSALEFFNNRLWSVNDSGHENIIYSFEPSEIPDVTGIKIYPSSNIDWESLAQDENNFYIADCGDNYGRREDITIYIVPKVNILSGNGLVSDSIIIRFNEKTAIPASVKMSAFDCEAVTVINDSLYLFTKNWVNYTSAIYIIPSRPGNYNISQSSTIQTNLLVTGADYCRLSGDLWLIGYKNYRPAILSYPGFNAHSTSNFSYLRFNLRRYIGLQVEGITCAPDGSIYFCSEKTIYPARLYKLVRKD